MKKSLVTFCPTDSSAGFSPLIAAIIVSALVFIGTTCSQAAVTLADDGGTAPTPGANDVSQLSTAGDTGSPNSKNYYSNNNPPPGEKFTTGSNAGGYTMTDIYVETGNGAGNGIGGSTAWTLYIYSVSGSTATLLTSCSGLTTGATLNSGDWLHFGGLSIPLAANTTYAYAISSGSTAYTGLENSSTALSGANALLLPTGGGAVTTVSGYNGVFDIGLSAGMSGTVSEQSSAPVPGANDISQLNTTGDTANPNSKNYFSNNNSSSTPVPPSQEFTTSDSNPGGYTLTNIYVQTGNGSGNGIGALSPWTLYIFSVSGSTATLLQSYSGILGTSFAANDWIQFSNLSVNLAANATYAFGISTSGNGSGPYTGFENTTAALTGANALLVNAGSGAITTVTGFNGVFDLGLSPIAAPGPPTGVTAMPGNNQVTLSWTAPGGTVTGYDIYRSTTSNSGYTLLAAGSNISGSPFTDTTAVNGTTYYYVVTSLNGSLQSSYSSQVSGTPPRNNTVVTWNGIQTSDDNWTLSLTEGNWTGASSGNYYLNGDTAIFNDDSASGAQSVSLNVTVNPASVAFANTNVIYMISGSGAISGLTGVTNAGPGTVMLAETGGDNFNGGVNVRSGELVLDDANSTITGGSLINTGAVMQVGNNDGKGAVPSGPVTNNGTLVFDDGGQSAVSSVIAGSGTLIQGGGNQLELSGQNSFAGMVIVTNNSTLQAGNDSAFGPTNGPVTVANGSTLDENGFYNDAVANKPVFALGTGIGGNGALVNNNGYGDLLNVTLTGDTTIGGSARFDETGTLSTGGNAYNLTITGGAYHEFNDATVDTNLADITLTGTGTTLGDKGTTALGNPADTIEIQDGTTLQFWNNGPNTTLNKNVLIDSGGTLQNGNGVSLIVGPVTLGAGVCYFQIGNTSLALNGPLGGSGILDMLDTSTGSLVVNGDASAFTGGAYVYGGDLVVNSVFGSGVVCESGATLEGTGTVEGLADVYGALAPGNNGMTGTFNAAGGLTLEGGATMTNALSATVSGSNDLVTVTGNLTVNGNTIVLNLVNGTLQNGIYPLIKYTGSLNGSFAAVQTAAPTVYSLTLTNITSTSPNEVAVVAFGTPSQLTWNNGSGDGEWNAGGSLNWTNYAAHDEEQFFNAESVNFDDSITNSANAALPTSTNITISAGQTISPVALTNNSTVNYTISGAGEISGAAGIAKAGSSTLTISNINNFSGGITINGGTVQSYGSDGDTALGAGTPVVNSGATLIGLDADAFGYAANTAPTNIFINGGTVSDLGTVSYRITMPNITFAGGTLTSASGNAGDSDGNYSTFGNGTTCNITTLATNTTAVISAGTMGFGKPTVFNTAAGNVATGLTPGIDLWVTTKLVPYGIQPLTKAGAGVMALDSTNSATWNDPITISAGTLQLGTSNDSAGLIAPAGVGNVTNDATLLIDSSEMVSVSNIISGIGNLVVAGGTAVLTAASTYTGNTVVNGGTLALSGVASIADSPDVIIGGSGTLNVSGLSSAFTLGASQTLSNSSSRATINGSVGAGLGTLSLAYNSGTPSLSVANGTLTVSAGTVVTINNLGSALPVGSYTIVSAGTGGAVSGTAPSTVTVNGGGVAAGEPVSLQINSGGLALVVGSLASAAKITGISVSGTTLNIMAVNGADGGQFVLVENTNLLAPLNQWTPVLTNNFGPGGTLNLSTNIINPLTPREFYLLEMP
ncbi:MAG TPA: autotransporter-associated beta strand repeat-containing protein [Verrucomicrobiae bacterium]|nr:autotransporter-associated beta strand repeat-containing protein [Verrucomicrobiae bacterium]